MMIRPIRSLSSHFVLPLLFLTPGTTFVVVTTASASDNNAQTVSDSLKLLNALRSSGPQDDDNLSSGVPVPFSLAPSPAIKGKEDEGHAVTTSTTVVNCTPIVFDIVFDSQPVDVGYSLICDESLVWYVPIGAFGYNDERHTERACIQSANECVFTIRDGYSDGLAALPAGRFSFQVGKQTILQYKAEQTFARYSQLSSPPFSISTSGEVSVAERTYQPDAVNNDNDNSSDNSSNNNSSNNNDSSNDSNEQDEKKEDGVKEMDSVDGQHRRVNTNMWMAIVLGSFFSIALGIIVTTLLCLHLAWKHQEEQRKFSKYGKKKKGVVVPVIMDDEEMSCVESYRYDGRCDAVIAKAVEVASNGGTTAREITVQESDDVSFLSFLSNMFSGRNSNHTNGFVGRNDEIKEVAEAEVEEGEEEIKFDHDPSQTQNSLASVGSFSQIVD